jgi:hypothetical protein
VSGDFGLQATTVPLLGASCSEQAPAIGGLLLWQDEKNRIAMLRGFAAQHDVVLVGLVDGESRVVGRGRVPSTPSQRIDLRLERMGEQVRALCGTNGRDWFAVGNITFPIQDPVQAGFVAVGAFERLFHPGAYRDGTATRFESCHLWHLAGTLGPKP